MSHYSIARASWSKKSPNRHRFIWPQLLPADLAAVGDTGGLPITEVLFQEQLDLPKAIIGTEF